MSCIEPRITSLKQYEKLYKHTKKQLQETGISLTKTAQLIDYLQQTCTEMLDTEPVIQCKHCQSNDTKNVMGVMYNWLRTRETKHIPYYVVCNNCNRVTSPTSTQKVLLAKYVVGHTTLFNFDNLREATYVLSQECQQTTSEINPQTPELTINAQ